MLIRQHGREQRLVDLLRKLPKLETDGQAGVRALDHGAEQGQPVVEFIRPYTPDFVGWLRDFGQGAANYDANGHYARIQPIFNAFSFADNPAGGTLTPIPPRQRLAGLADRPTRCPGAASQRAAGRLGAVRDTTAPRLRPVLVPPGP